MVEAGEGNSALEVHIVPVGGMAVEAGSAQWGSCVHRHTLVPLVALGHTEVWAVEVAE
jgi:hypothetical protein